MKPRQDNAQSAQIMSTRRRIRTMTAKRSTLVRLFVAISAVVFGILAAGLAIAARNSSGTYSLASGNPVVGGTTITSTWANTTLQDLAAEMTASLSRDGKGGMRAALKIVDGTVAAPAYTWTNEPASGLYRIGANNPGLSVNGSKRQEWSTTGSIVTGTLESTGAATVASLSSTGAVSGTTGTFSSAGSFGGALDMNSHLISEVTDPSGAQDAATKNYVDVTAGTSAATASALMRRDASGRVKVADPSASDDVATKAYVDATTDGTASITWSYSAPNGWQDYSSNTRLYKSNDGMITLQFWGAPYGTGQNANATILTLPAGYRPGTIVAAVMGDFANYTAVHARINTDGTVTSLQATTNPRVYGFTVTFK